jgi:hypothetical protein
MRGRRSDCQAVGVQTFAGGLGSTKSRRDDPSPCLGTRACVLAPLLPTCTPCGTPSFRSSPTALAAQPQDGSLPNAIAGVRDRRRASRLPSGNGVRGNSWGCARLKYGAPRADPTAAPLELECPRRRIRKGCIGSQRNRLHKPAATGVHRLDRACRWAQESGLRKNRCLGSRFDRMVHSQDAGNRCTRE